MGDPLAELEALAERVGSDPDDETFPSERAVQLRAVEPLLETLGWNVRGPAVVPEATVGTATVDYLLTIDGAPVVAVATDAPGADLQDEFLPRLERAIADGHVPRGIATDGREVVLLAASDGEVHRRSFPFGALPDQADALGQYHRSTVDRTAGGRRSARQEAARRLGANRQDVAEAVTAEIVSVTGTAVEDVVADESARIVDAMIEALRPAEVDAAEGPSSTSTAGEQSSASPSPDGASAGVAGSEPAGESRPASARSREPFSGDDPVATSDDGTADSVDQSADDSAAGEYVARFFGGSNSVGAVGTETPRGTTVGVVRYLLENHDLFASVTLPWRDGDGRIVLAAQPEDRAWPSLENDRGDSVSVRPVDDPTAAKRTIEALADAAGLRVMFQGDW